MTSMEYLFLTKQLQDVRQLTAFFLVQLVVLSGTVYLIISDRKRRCWDFAKPLDFTLT